jgi:hypothetical protein
VELKGKVRRDRKSVRTVAMAMKAWKWWQKEREGEEQMGSKVEKCVGARAKIMEVKKRWLKKGKDDKKRVGKCNSMTKPLPSSQLNSHS